MANCRSLLAAVVILGIITGHVYSQCDTMESQLSTECLKAVTEGAEDLPNNPVPRQGFAPDFEAYVNLTFFTMEEELDFCCEKYRVPAKTFELNPIKNENPLIEFLRNVPAMEVSTASKADTSLQYTVILLDLETNQQLRAQWLVMNIPHDDLSLGETVLSYDPPTEAVRYMLILYMQTQSISVANLDMQKFTNGTGPRCDGETRCNFDEGDFRKTTGLRPLGVTWVKPTESDFQMYARYQSGKYPKNEVCSGRQDVVDVDEKTVECTDDGNNNASPSPGGDNSTGVINKPAGATPCSDIRETCCGCRPVSLWLLLALCVLLAAGFLQ